MKYLYLLPVSLLLTSCDGFRSWLHTPTGPPTGKTPAEIIGDAGPAVIEDATSGNWVGAAAGAGGIIAALLGVKGYQKARDSRPGSLGILAKSE